MSKEDDFQSILENGISFGRGGGPRQESGPKRRRRNTLLGLTGPALHDRKPNTVSNGLTGINNTNKQKNGALSQRSDFFIIIRQESVYVTKS